MVENGGGGVHVVGVGGMCGRGVRTRFAIESAPICSSFSFSPVDSSSTVAEPGVQSRRSAATRRPSNMVVTVGCLMRQRSYVLNEDFFETRQTYGMRWFLKSLFQYNILSWDAYLLLSNRAT